MRIIAGEFRGRKLLAPEGDVTRPITDRVKQSLFDILTPVIEGANVYDCFAGTGSMGLESLSRGARHATFFEENRSALGLLRKNIDILKVGDRATIVAGDIFRWAGNPPPLPSPGVPGEGIMRAMPVDIIFFDPPYRFLNERPGDLRTLAGQFAKWHLVPAGTLVFRHDAGDSSPLPGYTTYDERTYGGMVLEFLHPANTAPT